MERHQVKEKTQTESLDIFRIIAHLLSNLIWIFSVIETVEEKIFSNYGCFSPEHR